MMLLRGAGSYQRIQETNGREKYYTREQRDSKNRGVRKEAIV